MRLCVLTDRDGRPNWCERHQRHHAGVELELALDTTKRGVHARHAWDMRLLHNRDAASMQKILLVNKQAPGDFLVMTAALEAVAAQFPGRYAFKVVGCCTQVFDNNPHCYDFAEPDRVIEMQYPSLHESSRRDARYIAAYVEFLGDQLGLPLKPSTNRPRLYFAPEELSRPREFTDPYVLINSGWKKDGELKNWGFANWVEVSNWIQSKGFIVVQVGENNPNHVHRRLPGVIDLVGQTDLRRLFLLAYRSEFGCGAESMLHHVCAAFQKPFVTLANGHYMSTWANYPTEKYLTRHGQLDCCPVGGCGKTTLNGGKNPCTYPDKVGDEGVALCLKAIPPAEVIAAIEQWYGPGGVLSIERGATLQKRLEARLACKFRGEPTGKTHLCQECTGIVQAEELACAVHGVCTLKNLASGVACCKICKERAA